MSAIREFMTWANFGDDPGAEFSELFNRAVAEAIEANDVRGQRQFGAVLDEIYTATDSGADYEAGQQDYEFPGNSYTVGILVSEEQYKLIEEVRAAAKEVEAERAECEQINAELDALRAVEKQLYARREPFLNSYVSPAGKKLEKAQKALAEYLSK